MGVYSIGDLIKRTRKSMGISRKELCDDICSVETLCRIENGKQSPNRYTYRMLMNRMGKTGEKYQLYIHGDEDTIIGWEKLSLLAASRRYKELDRALKEFENSVDTGDTLNKQYLLRMRAITDYRLGRIDLLQERSLFLQAIKYTIPNFDSKMIPDGMFTRYEIALICNIAATYEKEDINTSIFILKQLSEYFKNIKVDDEERSLSEVFVLLNLARFLGIQGNSLEAKEIESMLLDVCIKGGKGSNLASILYNLAYEEELLGIDVSVSQKHLLQAYYAASLFNNDDMKKHILMHIEEKYCMDLRKNQVGIHPKLSSLPLS